MKAHSDSQVNWTALSNTLGHSVLIETMKYAAYYVHHSNGLSKSRVFVMNMKEAKSCYFFVQGTSLNKLISRFGMEYDAEKIRETFNYCVRHT